MSADGRLVAFESRASNLVPGDTNGSADIFVHDLQTGSTELDSLSSTGLQGNGASWYPSLSADGRFVAFTSNSSNLVPGDANGAFDTFVRDRFTGLTERVSVTTNGTEADLGGYTPAISGDGRFVAFESDATNLVQGDTNSSWDIFVHDRQTGTTERVSVSSSGGQGNGDSNGPVISSEGRFVGFWSFASNLVSGDTNGRPDAFVHDRLTGITERISIATNGVQGDDTSIIDSISADGRFVSFTSGASNLAPGDTNGACDIFIRDRILGTTELVSLGNAGQQGNMCSGGSSIASGNRYVAFQSEANNLVPGDTNAHGDMFLRDLDATGFSSVCDPGVASIVGCPCSNPPSSVGRGCDNSAATGGASLVGSGNAYLSIDSVVFSSNGEPPTSVSIVVQGNSLVANGAVYGQGVRCVGGATKRLFTKTAVAGSITAPDFGAGDPTVSARSAAKGDVIQPGQSRWYLVYYRDQIVLGGCPASSTFNATQTGQVSWWP
jgi:hypothetical protein